MPATYTAERSIMWAFQRTRRATATSRAAEAPG
jgi:hypothetical protein